MREIIVLYHADCPDGFGGAWVAHKKFGDKADYVGVHHDLPPPEGLENKEIYMIDFTYPTEIVREMISRNKSVTSIDHHVTREEATKLTKDYLYAVNNSGSVLAWKYFNKDEPVPLLLQFIEDQDLWKFKFPETAPIVTCIDSYDYDFLVWDRLIKEVEDEETRKIFLEKGNLMLKYKDEMIKRIIESNAKVVEFEGYVAYAVNAPHEFASEIGANLIAKKPPLAIIWYEGNDGVHVSLRSDGTVDVSKVAEKFGGGGHKASAGFSLTSLNKLPWKENI